jgi:beta-phosphoglucomutase
MRFQGAIFDIDGVLVDSPHERAWREALERLMTVAWTDLAGKTRYAPDRFTSQLYHAAIAGKPREAGARAALEYFGIPDPDGRRLQEYCAVKQADLIALIERGEFVAFDDAVRFLLRLKAAGMRVAAASSSKNADLFLRKVPLGKYAALSPTGGEGERAGAGEHDHPLSPEWERGPGGEGLRYSFLTADSTLLDTFDANVNGRDVARGKPDPEIFLAAAAALGLPPANCIVVEDAPVGVQAAKAGGMACVAIARIGEPQILRDAGADWVVSNFDDLAIATLLE